MNPRLLLVDDEEMFLEYLSKRLIRQKYDVTTCLNGEDAIEKIKGSDFDVAIIDVIMPGIDGIETLQEIKRIKPLTEAIILTGHASREQGVEGMRLGAYDYLRKPCDPEDLVFKIKEAFKKKVECEIRIKMARLQDSEE
ncbi:MAG: response regulator [Proteobacteria bacterium]|nr:response regulator [Pseudomonadota bacterium]MBU4298372.1 response regulator [Pseudomonadota bacterium]MCG2746927.1 response regulator [Desulfobulbaceae bacterium]